MNTVKVSISVGDTSIQLEGPQEFVERYLDKYSSLIEKSRSSPPSRAEAEETIESEENETSTKLTRTMEPRSEASCSDRIRALIDENYFDEPRGIGEVVNWLKDSKGFIYNANQVAASLISITRSGKLRQFGKTGSYKYMSP